MKDFFDLTKRDDLIQLKNNIALAIKESQSVIVFNKEQVDKAGFYIKKFNELHKTGDKVKKEIAAPIKADLKHIDELFKTLFNESEKEESRLRNEVNEFLQEMREKQEKEKQQEQKELESNELFSEDTTPTVEIKREGLGNISDNLTSVRHKTWIVEDITKIPIEFLIINDKLINELRRKYDFEDTSPIPGIKFSYSVEPRIK